MRELVVVINATCPLECAHCCTASGPRRKERIGLEAFGSQVGALDRTGLFSSVVFSGGEPTLLGAELHNAIKICKRNKWRTHLVTSASWATSARRADDVLHKLRLAGLDEITFSWDDAHEVFVPISRIVLAWSSAKRFGFTVVTISNAHGPRSRWTPQSIQTALGEKIPVLRGEEVGKQEFSNQSGTKFGIVNQHLQRIGRGKSQVAREAVGRRDARDAMALTCPSSIENPALSVKGRLVACGGMELDENPFLDFGDVTKRDAAEVYIEAHANIVAQAIRYLGPGPVVTFLAHEEGEDVPENDFISICEICQDLTTEPKWVALLRKHQHKLVPHVLAAARRKGDQMTVKALEALPAAALPQVNAYRPVMRGAPAPLAG